MTDETLRIHYIIQHSVNENNYFFKDLFLPDNVLKSCNICMMEFKNCRVKKNHIFLFHYNQSGGSRMNQQLPVSVVTRGPVTYFSINYNGHKKFYDFFQEDVVDDFLQGVYNRFNPGDEYKFQGYAEIINQQKGESVVKIQGFR